MAICSEYRIEVGFFHCCMTLIMTLVSGDLKNRSILFVCFVALRSRSTAMVIAGRSVHLTTLFPGQA